MIQEKKKNEADNEKAGIINENFDPALLGDDEIDFKKTISPESKSDNFDDLLFETPESKPLPEEMDGFRVQICAVSDEQKAKQAQRDAIIQFMDNEVYLEYHAPYYKIRIGNCISRFEAEQLQKLAMQKGFADAWVVKTKVKPNLNKENPPEKNVEAPPN
jgi:hypothetical protein